MGRRVALEAESGVLPEDLATQIASAGFSVGADDALAVVLVLDPDGRGPVRRAAMPEGSTLIAVSGVSPGARARAWKLSPAAVVGLDAEAIVAALNEHLPPEAPTKVALVDGWLDLDARRVQRGDDEGRLTEMEVGLLRYLTARPNTIVSNEEILLEVWGYRPGLKTRAAHNTVRRLRSKVEADPSAPRHLLTEHGVGFRWATADPSVAALAATTVETSLFGRQRELADLLELLGPGGPPLVTLVGPGGVGKTSLLREVAPSLEGGVFVDAAAARDPEALAVAVADALGGTLGGGDLIVAVGHMLAERGPSMLLLDNLEQVRPSPAEAVGHWLAAAPTTVVATSRNPLHLPAERLFTVGPLAPGGQAARDLFEARARASAPSFEVADEAVLTDVLGLLDGLPLAIELAAPRVRVLGLAQLRERLTQDLAALRTRRQDVDDRHASLEAALRWSWDLLGGEQKRAMVALSCFEGPFQATEAIDVLGGDPLDAEELLEDLVDASLLVAGKEPGWWRQLRSVQTFARAEGESLGFLESTLRHGACFAALGAPGRLVGMDRRAARGFRGMRARINELEVALDRCLDRGDLTRASTLLRAVAAVRTRTGPTAPLRRRLEAFWSSADDALRCEAIAFVASPGLLATLGLQADDLSRAHASAGALSPPIEALVLGQRAQAEHGRAELPAAETLYAAAEAVGGKGASAWHLCDRAAAARKRGAVEDAERWLLAAESQAEQADDRRMLASVLFGRALIAYGRGDVERAEEQQRRGRDLARTLGDGRLQLVAESNLAILLQHLGRLDEAATALRMAVQGARELGNQRSEAKACTNLGYVELARGNLDAARAAGGQAARLADALEIHDTAARARLNLAMAWVDDDPARALKLGFEAEALVADVQDPQAAQFVQYVVGRSLLAGGRPGDAVERFVTAAADARDEGLVGREVEALAWLGYAQDALGQAEAASVAWGRARAVAEGNEVGAEVEELLNALPSRGAVGQSASVH